VEKRKEEEKRKKHYLRSSVVYRFTTSTPYMMKTRIWEVGISRDEWSTIDTSRVTIA
jgi:hypothetical protein